MHLRECLLSLCRYLALRWGADANAHSGHATQIQDDSRKPQPLGLQAQSLYHDFSVYMRRITPVVLPVVCYPSKARSSAGVGGAAGGAGGQSEQRRRWWLGGRTVRKSRGAASAASTLSAGSATAAPRGHALTSPATSSQVMGDFIRDKQWNESKARSEAGARARDRLRKGSKASTSANSLQAGMTSPEGSVPDAFARALPRRMMQSWCFVLCWDSLVSTSKRVNCAICIWLWLFYLLTQGECNRSGRWQKVSRNVDDASKQLCRRPVGRQADARECQQRRQ